MKAGRASRTAEWVGMGRALGGEDPTAMTLLPEEARETVERVRRGDKPRGLRDGLYLGYLRKQSEMMVARTRAIDAAITEARATQVVILGAGLDGRAWRMDALRDAVVFEVDHPDSQRDKRARAGALTRTAREVRFVPVDFGKDDLERGLAAAGHDATRATTWIWEGVVMYLDLEAILATMAVIGRRSAPGSRLCVLYHAPHPILWLIARVVRRIGEPLRSAFTPGAMKDLLLHHGFRVAHDRAIAMGHLRLAVADA